MDNDAYIWTRMCIVQISIGIYGFEYGYIGIKTYVRICASGMRISGVLI